MDSRRWGRIVPAAALVAFLVFLSVGTATARSVGFAAQVRAAERRAAARLAATERSTPAGRYAYYTAGNAWKYSNDHGWASGYASAASGSCTR